MKIICSLLIAYNPKMDGYAAWTVFNHYDQNPQLAQEHEMRMELSCTYNREKYERVHCFVKNALIF